MRTKQKPNFSGGTIDLFNGMSFITLIDLFILAIEFLGERFKRRKQRKLRNSSINDEEGEKRN